MQPILERIAEREATAGAAAEALRARITALTEQLALAEGELAELAITRTTLTRLTGDTQATPSGDATIASPAYQNILAVFTNTVGGMRAKDVCLALGAGVTPKHTEGIRAKLKRLVTRHILAETEPGLFTLASTPSA